VAFVGKMRSAPLALLQFNEYWKVSNEVHCNCMVCQPLRQRLQVKGNIDRQRCQADQQWISSGSPLEPVSCADQQTPQISDRGTELQSLA